MSYLPSPYTGYFTRVDNTVVSGSQLLSYLSGDDVRDLEFEAMVHTPVAVNPVLGPSTLTSAAVSTLTPQQVIQASIQTLPVKWPTVSPAVTGATGYISLGPDTASQALAWINVFNLTSSNDRRVLRFVNVGDLGYYNQVLLGNSSNTATYVVPRAPTGGITTVGASCLFTATGAVGAAFSGQVGSERMVVVSATGSTTLTTVYFDVLGNSQ